ncbi:diguanylate cyclase domain-containing protein [Noviherbaspirillum soli]|uniref:diguanylate cyclase domain-containing protein n=1 Tax=Noviherbaspirillum soli TaxID=1064518 RepID=UPI00188AE03D|nr:GGDEF domain-containing protein [Noviherbaspirillum soli]
MLFEVPDCHGHLYGDHLLKATARRLQENKRQEDTLARIGGDEFIFLLHQISNKNEVSKSATRMLRAMEEPFDINGVELRLTISIGIAFYPDDAHDRASLVRAADKALYKAKRSGENDYAWVSPKSAFS